MGVGVMAILAGLDNPMVIGYNNPMQYKKASVKADLTRLFQLGFKPSQLPPFGVGRLTVQRYYRAWLANGGRVAWWRRWLVWLLTR